MLLFEIDYGRIGVVKLANFQEYGRKWKCILRCAIYKISTLGHIWIVRFNYLLVEINCILELIPSLANMLLPNFWLQYRQICISITGPAFNFFSTNTLKIVY